MPAPVPSGSGCVRWNASHVARVADDLGEDLGAPRDGAVPLLEDDDSRAFGDDEAVAVGIERT